MDDDGGFEISRCGFDWGAWMARLCSAFQLCLIDHAAAFADFLFHECHEVVSQAQEPRLLGLGGGTACPCFGFAELVLEFVEDFFDVPAGLIKQGDEARWNGSG